MKIEHRVMCTDLIELSELGPFRSLVQKIGGEVLSTKIEKDNHFLVSYEFGSAEKLVKFSSIWMEVRKSLGKPYWKSLLTRLKVFMLG